MTERRKGENKRQSERFSEGGRSTETLYIL